MRLPARSTQTTELPGVVGTARVGRRVAALAPRLRPGDIAVIDDLDLDRAGAQTLVDRGVVAVVDAQPLISGRYPNLGPRTLAAAGVVLVDGVGSQGLAAIRDGQQVRVHDGTVFRGQEQLAAGRVLDLERVEEEMTAARAGLVTQLESLTRNSAVLLRREQGLLLHGEGLPRLATRMTGRAAVVVVAGHEHLAELRRIRPYLREQEPVVIAVGRAADDLRARGQRVHVVVVDADDDSERPSAAVLKAAQDVVVRVEPGRTVPTDGLARLGVRPLTFETAATPEDVGLLLADKGGATIVVGVGLHASLEELLDRQRSGLASTYLTRLRLGPRLVDAQAVPYLYSGRVRPHHLFLVMLAGLVALAAAMSVTPAGQELWEQLRALTQEVLR